MFWDAKQSSNGLRKVLRKKFTFAAWSMVVATGFAAYGLLYAGTNEEIVAVLNNWNEIAWKILGLVFSADVAEKFVPEKRDET